MPAVYAVYNADGTGWPSTLMFRLQVNIWTSLSKSHSLYYC